MNKSNAPECSAPSSFKQACLTGFLALSVLVPCQAQNPTDSPAYMDTTLSFEQRATDLVSRMTLEEKAAQLINDAPAIPRLNVREFDWWSEGLHGVAAAGEATVFPQAIGMAATWNAPLMEEVAGIIGVEFRANYEENKHRLGGSEWFSGLSVWSPNINIFRDPRWGRGQETYGEDPYLTSRLGVSFVKGLQGDDPRYLMAVATPKHFAVHSGPESSRHRDDIHPNQRDLEETYLPAFRATVVEGRAHSIMCAYNAVNGAPACASEMLLDDYLRKQWDFNGYVVSDCGAVLDVYEKNNHHYVNTPEEAIAKTFTAGMDLICGSAKHAEHILSAVRKGLVTEAVLNRSLVRLFTARMRLGEFDPGADVFPRITARDNDTPKHRAKALQVARESLVLLKNDNNLLPLKTAPKNIVVIGKNADSVDPLVGNYNGTPSHPVTILKGIRERFSTSKVTYAEGFELLYPLQSSVPDSVFCLTARCKKNGLRFEQFATRDMHGKPMVSTEVKNAHIAWEGEKRRSAARWSGFLKAPESGEYYFRFAADGGYRIWIDNKMVIDSWNVDWRPSMLSGSIELTEGKVYPIRIESFQRRDHGDERLVWSLPSDQGAREALSAAQKSDLVVFVAGLTAALEGEEMPLPAEGFEGGDRVDLDLPRVQEALLRKVAELGKPVVLVLTNGSALAVNWADQHIPAIVEAWYPGGQGGEAVAELLAGDFSPSGRLPVTFYRSVDQLPPFGDYSMQGRTYRYFAGDVLYPFGYGLSYTSFAYDKPRMSSSRIKADENINVSVRVTNTGNMAGDEVVQLYLSHPNVDGAPIRSLKGFKRVALKQGQSETVTFTLSKAEFALVDDNGVHRVMSGPVNVWIGGGQVIESERLAPAAGVLTSFEITSESTL